MSRGARWPSATGSFGRNRAFGAAERFGTVNATPGGMTTKPAFARIAIAIAAIGVACHLLPEMRVPSLSLTIETPHFAIAVRL